MRLFKRKPKPVNYEYPECMDLDCNHDKEEFNKHHKEPFSYWCSIHKDYHCACCQQEPGFECYHCGMMICQDFYRKVIKKCPMCKSKNIYCTFKELGGYNSEQT
jgi:hypothetical protein